MLNSVHLERFKKFKDTEVQLHPFTVLMGENGSGKTTVLQAINFALHSLYFRKLLYFNKGSIQVRERGVVLTLNDLPGMNVSEPMEIFYDKKKYKKLVKGIGDATLTLRDSLNNTYRLQLTANYRNFIVRCSSTPQDLEKISSLSSLQPLLISGFVGLRSTEERAFPRAIQDRLQTGRLSDIIRNLVLDMKEQKPQAYNLLNEQLMREFSFHLDAISFNPEQDINVNAYFKDTHEGRGITLDFNAAGSGFMQVLQILVPIYRFASTDATIFLLDEPDAHLHPNLQYTLAQVLRKAQKELDIQIILSTHSIPMIESADPSEVIPISARMQKNMALVGSQQVAEQISVQIDNYHLAKSKLSGKIVFAEDKNTEILQSFDRALGTNCFRGVNTVPLVGGKGKDDKMPFQVKELLQKYALRDVEVHFIIDSDGISDEWTKKLLHYAKNRGVIIHQLWRHEIESYLLNPDWFVRALTKKYPGKEFPSTEEIKEYMIKIMQDTIRDKTYEFDNMLEDRLYKVSRLSGESQGMNAIKKEMKNLRNHYMAYTTFEDLVRVAMGKETLKAVKDWLCTKKQFVLSDEEILECLKPEDVPLEIQQILQRLHSVAKQTNDF